MAQAPLRQDPADELRKHYPEFETRLLTRRKEVFERLQELRKQLDEQVMTSPGDMADESVIDTSADYFLTLANQLERESTEIDQALDRIHQGTYGMCIECGRPIAIERLRNLPFARYDVDCQSEKERRRPLRAIPKTSPGV